MQEQDTPSLVDLIHDWIRNDSVLSKHIQVVRQPFPEYNDGFYIETICRGTGSFLPRYSSAQLAWFTRTAALSEWTHLDKEPTNLSAADPSFFNKLHSLIRDAHNGSTQTTSKGNKWYTPRIGCGEDI